MTGPLTTADSTVSVTAALIYEPGDPYVVTARGAAWTIGRDLLLAGLTARAPRPAGMDGFGSGSAIIWAADR